MIGSVQQYKTVLNLFELLENFGIMSQHAHNTLIHDYGEFEPQECCGEAADDCYCYQDDYPDYDADYYKDEDEEKDSKPSPVK